MKHFAFFLLLVSASPAFSQHELSYKVEMSGTTSGGTYTPLWLSANRFGTGVVSGTGGYLMAGAYYNNRIDNDWRIDTGLDMIGGKSLVSRFRIHQAYMDVSWKFLSLSIGSKERYGFPLEKNTLLTSGWMTEGPNSRPVPQIRGEIHDFLSIPGLNGWLAFKGHLAYGLFLDSKWQENFVTQGKYFTRGAKYHSKSILFRLGNRKVLPLEFEFGMIMATQFGGARYKKEKDENVSMVMDMPDDLGAYWSAFFPQAGGSDTSFGEQMNVEGNMLGSWNFALNYYLGKWKLRAHLDHYFEDHSQMFWEYGRWKDGQLGIEITPPENRFVTSVLWEGLSTHDQTGPIAYEARWNYFKDKQTSGFDNYYNHGIYNAWQYYGNAMGNPLLPGPLYNDDHSISFKSNRVKAQHFGVCGNPTSEISWRVLATFSRHWGTYATPLDKVRRQNYSLAEVSYSPQWAKGWSVTVAGAIDRGNYLGNSTGGMLTFRKCGVIFK